MPHLHPSCLPSPQVEGAPKVVKEGLKKEEAEALQKTLADGACHATAAGGGRQAGRSAGLRLCGSNVAGNYATSRLALARVLESWGLAATA